jgi:hypothetical protein
MKKKKEEGEKKRGQRESTGGEGEVNI